MIALAILGLLQALFVPGLIAASLARFGWRDRLIIAPALSLILNYFMVLLLVSLDIYSQPVLIALFFVEVVAAIYLAKKAPKKLALFALAVLDRPYVSDYANAIIKIFSFVVIASVFLNQFNSVFTEWDAVVSWNRWAKDWFEGTHPVKRFSREEGSWTYPQSIPILYSVVYKFAGTTQIQNFARLLAAYYPFWGLFCFWRLGSCYKNLRLASSIAGLAYVFFIIVSQRVPDFAFSGYVDPVMAAFGAFLIYAICISIVIDGETSSVSLTKSQLLIICICLSGSALVKQNGVLVAFLFFAILMYANKSAICNNLRFWLLTAAVMGAVSLHWYFFKLLEIKRGIDVVGYGGGVINVLLWDRPWWAALKLFDVVGWVALVSMMVSLVQKKARNLIAFLLVPLFLFWAFFISYDLRSAYICYPLLAAAVGLGFVTLLKHARHESSLYIVAILLSVFGVEMIYRNIFTNFGIGFRPVLMSAGLLIVLYVAVQLSRYKVRNLGITSVAFSQFNLFVIFILLSVLLLSVARVYVSDEALLAENEIKRSESNDHGFNQLISDIFKSVNKETYILSSWQLLYNLPATEGHYLFRYCGDVDVLAKRNVDYYLHDPSCDAVTLEKARAIIRANSEALIETLLPDNFVLLSKVRLPAKSVDYIDFRKRSWPGALISVKGISSPENWGAWSIGGRVELAFARELPRSFNLTIRARAFGPNVSKPFTISVGAEKKQINIGLNQAEYVLFFQTDGSQKMITIEVPKPSSPRELGLGGDSRQLGIALTEIHIAEVATN